MSAKGRVGASHDGKPAMFAGRERVQLLLRYAHRHARDHQHGGLSSQDTACVHCGAFAATGEEVPASAGSLPLKGRYLKDNVATCVAAKALGGGRYRVNLSG